MVLGLSKRAGAYRSMPFARRAIVHSFLHLPAKDVGRATGAADYNSRKRNRDGAAGSDLDEERVRIREAGDAELSRLVREFD